MEVKVKETRYYKLDLELSEQAGAARGLLYNLNIEGKVHEENPYK